MWVYGLGSTVSGYDSVGTSYEHGTELLGFIKCGEFLDYLSEYQFLRTCPATRS
jgi:hypothetical protein